MSLSAPEQQALDLIEDELAGSDARLAALLATFARLTSGDAMPARETIRVAGRPTRGAGLLCQRPGFRRAAPLLGLLITLALAAVGLALSRGGGGVACTQSWPVVCTAPAPAHSPGPAVHKTAADPALHAAW